MFKEVKKIIPKELKYENDITPNRDINKEVNYKKLSNRTFDLYSEIKNSVEGFNSRSKAA
jgi:hypothetical protein